MNQGEKKEIDHIARHYRRQRRWVTLLPGEERLNVPLADLGAQYLEVKSQVDAAIADVMQSGLFVGGPRVQELEEQIAELCGAKYGIGVASGTDALVLSLVACGIGDGDEVITTPFSFGATTEAIALVGAIPVYADIDNCTFNLDTERIVEKITPRTKAILPVDLYGQMVDRKALTDIARRHNLRLIIDSAQAIGARQNGLPIGMHSDTTTLSFYPTKNLGAAGDAGMILTNNSELNATLRSLRGHGTRGHKYYYERIGYCSRLDAIQAVVLQAKLPRVADWNAARRANAERYHQRLANLNSPELTLPRAEDGNEHIYHQYTVRSRHRDALQTFLKEQGIASEIYYPHPLHLQPAYAYLGYREGDFPRSERAAREALSLPIHPELTEAQLDYVAENVTRFVVSLHREASVETGRLPARSGLAAISPAPVLTNPR